MHKDYTNSTSIPQIVYDRNGAPHVVAPGATWSEDDFTPESELFGFIVGAPALAVADRFVAEVAMKVGAYTVANPSPADGLARNVTVTHTTQGGTADILGTINVTGTDIEGKVISEVITPVTAQTVAGLKAFKTITDVVGAGWAIDGGGSPAADHIMVGFGNAVGLPVPITAAAKVIAAALGTGFINVPTVVAGATISQCTIDCSSGTYDGTKKLRVFLNQ
jgi:hypothetical protein